MSKALIDILHNSIYKANYARCLILVDLQNDFFSGGALAVKDAESILPVIQKLLKLPWELIVATKDWHPHDHMSFTTTHHKKIGDIINYGGLKQIIWPRHCVQNTLGSEFTPGWDSSKVHAVFYKGTDKEIDSYSAFFDNGHLHSTGLDQFLKEKGIQEVFIAGVVTDYCVKYSAIDARRLGFQVTVIQDACRAVNVQEGDEGKAIEEMKKEGVHFISSDDMFPQTPPL